MKINNTYRIIFSVFLLSVFSLVILPVKSLHHHEHAEVHSDYESGFQNAEDEDCAICNFHFETFSIDFSNQNISQKITSELSSSKVVSSPLQNTFSYKSLRAPPLV
jgi:hypothetical protein